MYYSRDGQPLCLFDWARSFENTDRHIGDDAFNGIRVSTVFMGLDHQHDPTGPPLLYETMVFGGDYNYEFWRHSTEETARVFHEAVVSALREGRLPPEPDFNVMRVFIDALREAADGLPLVEIDVPDDAREVNDERR